MVSEEGPFKIFKNIRILVGIEHDENGAVFMVPDRFLPKLFSCVWCVSVWVSGAFLILLWINSTVAFYFSLWMAFSAISILVEKWVRK